MVLDAFGIEARRLRAYAERKQERFHDMMPFPGFHREAMSHLG